MSLDSPRPGECPRLREYGYSMLARRRVRVDGRDVVALCRSRLNKRTPLFSGVL